MTMAGCAAKETETSASDNMVVEIAESARVTESAPEKITLRIMAAASLTEMFTEIESAYENEHPQIDLQMSFAGSQSLATQIQEGVAADVFACANTKYMALLVEEGLVNGDDVALFAKNKLAIVTMKSLEEITSYGDFISSDYKIVIAHEIVPVGKYTLAFLDKAEAVTPGYTAAFMAQVVSKETNVKIVASKVELGEADAGIVYRTDLTDSNKDLINIVDIPDEQNVIATYPISKLAVTKHEGEANAFVGYMLSDNGRFILEKYGFNLDGL